MATLNQIVDVQITRETKIPTQRGFGTPLILGDSDRFAADERVRTYTSIEQVVADFTAGDAEIQMATDMFSQTVRPPQIKIGQREAGDASWTAALNAIEGVDSDWYGLVTESRVEADILEIAVWVEARIKIFLALTSDDDAKNGVAGNVLEDLNAAAYDRSSGWYSGDADNHLTAGLVGLQLPKDPGSTNWAHKTVNGITFDDLSATQQQNIESVKGNQYIRVAGLNVTQFGTMASGEYIDVIRGADFIQARIQELVFFELVNSEKIPYTNDGIAQIENRLREALQLGVANQIINDDFTITVPDVADVSVIDKGNRFLPDVEFEATLTGAINKTQIRGRLVL